MCYNYSVFDVLSFNISLVHVAYRKGKHNYVKLACDQTITRGQENVNTTGNADEMLKYVRSCNYNVLKVFYLDLSLP